jgi:cytochrome P450
VRLRDDRELKATMSEEVLRWSTPILHMRRTATEDTELAGTSIAQGDKVVMWYASANRDEQVFDNAASFDIGRADNPQFSFGGGGPHFCLGAWLARLEIEELFGEMAERGMSLAMTDAPVRTPSNFVHGVLSVGFEPHRA